MRRRSSQSWKLPSNSHSLEGCSCAASTPASPDGSALASFGVLFQSRGTRRPLGRTGKATLEALKLQGQPMPKSLHVHDCADRDLSISKVQSCTFPGIFGLFRELLILSLIHVMAHVGRSC